MDLSLLIITLSVMCLLVCQPRSVTDNKDVIKEGKERQENETNYQRKKTSAEDYNSQAVNSNYHPYGLDTLGRGNIY
jgi:hypothetical protein